MKSLICIQPGLFECKETAMPVAAEERTILKIERIGISGTYLHAYTGTQPFFNYPRILRNEIETSITTTAAAGFTNVESVKEKPL